jgi:hypothetical protein
MGIHDIIDNRELRLVDQINLILGSTESAKMAVGYFFLSGLEAIVDRLEHVESIKLLIGNTSNRETMDQIAEGYQRIDLAEASLERENFASGTVRAQRAEETADNVRRSIERMDQTDGAQSLVKTLASLIEQERLHVRVYTRGRLHAKAYIFDYRNDDRFEKGIAIVGSSNLTLAGLTHNTELNVIVHGNSNHARLTEWFDSLWDASDEFDESLLEELHESWAAQSASPYDIYMKALYTLVADRLDGADQGELLWDDELTRSLADFQKTAVRQAVQMIRDRGGAFVSDVVGLGKSYIGAAILKHFVRTEGARPLIICPKPLEEMWTRYNDKFELGAKVLPMSLLKEESGERASILEQEAYRERDFILVDESHNFRNATSQRYEVLTDFLWRGMKKVCLLTATPQNRSAADIYHQIRLFHQDDITSLPIDPPDLKEYFELVASGERRLQELLVHILIRRARRHILRWYGYAEDSGEQLSTLPESSLKSYLTGEKKAYVMVGGRHQFFPKRELETLTYSIEETYEGLYEELRGYLGRGAGSNMVGEELTYARYGLGQYVLPEKQNLPNYRELQSAGRNLRGLIRVMLFKRFESSVYAFRMTLERLEKIHGYFLDALEEGFVPAGQQAQKILYESDALDDSGLMDALADVSKRYSVSDFDGQKLRADLESDRRLLQKMLDRVKPITPDKDAKLVRLREGLESGIPQASGKVLIFSQYADTVQYLYEQISEGGKKKEVDAIYGTEKSKARMAARFSPMSNPQFEVAKQDEVQILIATDVMSEGLNLQDGDVVVNYDLHWNPVRLIQRFGRIDRIGTENEFVWGFNFLPETGLDRQLGLTEILRRRIQEIQDTIGEDAAILDKNEQVNEEAMFAIYEKNGAKLAALEEDDLLDIGEAEELLRSMRSTNPAELRRIVALRDGIRSARGVVSGGPAFVFCQAGKFQQLMLVDENGRPITRDVAAALGKIKCAPTEPTALLPERHNERVMTALRTFAEEVTHRQAQQKYGLAITPAQAYVLRELRTLYGRLEEGEADLKAQINRLEEAFKHSVTAAVRRHLNTMRRNGMVGLPLLKALTDVYHDHGLHEHVHEERRRHEIESEELPRVICSEALV